MLGRYITGEKNGYFNKTLGQEKYKHLPIAFQEYYHLPDGDGPDLVTQSITGELRTGYS